MAPRKVGHGVFQPGPTGPTPTGALVLGGGPMAFSWHQADFPRQYAARVRIQPAAFAGDESGQISFPPTVRAEYRFYIDKALGPNQADVPPGGFYFAQQRRPIVPPPFVGPINGDASITEADDTVASAGVLLIQASAAIAEASDSLAATGVLPIQATAAITEADDSLTAAATLAIKATAAITEAGDALAATGALSLQATASITEAGDALSAAAALAIQATAALTEAGDTLTSTASLSSVHDGETLDTSGIYTGREYGERKKQRRKAREIIRDAVRGVIAKPAPAETPISSSDATRAADVVVLADFRAVEADEEEIFLLLVA